MRFLSWLKRSMGKTIQARQMMVALSQTAIDVQRARSADEVYATVGQAVARLGFQVTIMNLMEDKETLGIAHLNADPKLLQAAEGLVGVSVDAFEFTLGPDSAFRQVVESGEPVLLDPFADAIRELLPAPVKPMANSIAEMMSIQQALVAPMGPAGSVRGILVVSGKGLVETDLPAISIFANQISTALENNRLFEQTQACARELETRVEERTAELKVSEEKFRGAFEHAAIGRAMANPQGQFVQTNQAFCDLLGYTSEEMLAMQWMQITHPDHLPVVTAQVEKLIEGDKPSFQVELKLLPKKGEKSAIWANLSVVLIRDPKDQPLYMIGDIVDITERKQAEDALWESSQLLEQVFSSVDFLIAYIDTDFNYIRVNRAYAEADEHDPEYLAGKNHFDLYPNEEDRAVFRQVVDTGQPYRAHARSFVYPDHPERGLTYWNWSLQPIKDIHGTVTGLVFSLVDVTERERAVQALRFENERFLRFFDSNIVGIVIADASGKIIMANDYYLDLLGVTRQDFEAGKVDWLKFTPPEWLPADEEALKELNERGVCEPYEKEYIRSDGVRVPVYLADAMLPGPDEQIAAFVLDITERKQAEAALKESEERYRGIYDTAPVSIWREDWSEVIAGFRELRTKGVSDFRQYFDDHPDFVTKALKDVKILDVNDETLKMFKAQTKDEMLASLDTVFSTEDTLPGFAGELLALSEGQQLYRTEMALRTVESDLLHVLLTMTFPEDDSTSGEVLVSLVDITERRRAELALEESLGQLQRAQETLRENEDKIQNLIRHSSSMFYTHNTEHTLTYVGPQSRVILDCEPEEAMVRWQEFVSNHPVNQQGIESTERAIRTARRQPHYEMELITRKNRKIWVQVDESPVVKDGKTVAIVGSLTDITARKLAEEKLRESEERFRALIENSNDAIALLDVNGTILFESPAGSRILGFSRAELLGRSALEMLHPDDQERVSALFDSLVDSNLNLKAEFRFQHKDSSWRWVEAIGTNMLEVPAVHAIVINYRDITERKQAEEKIVFQANLLAAVGSAVIATDAEGRVQYWNSAAESMYGWSSTEALGKSITELTPAQQSQEEAQVFMDRLVQGKSWSGDFLLQRKDGKTFPAFVVNSPILDSDGKLSGVIGVSNDLSALKQAQAEIAANQRRFEALINHAPDGIALLGLDGKLQQVTPSVEYILGYSLEEARDQDPAQLTHPDDLPGLLALLNELVQHPGKTVRTEYRFRHKDGSWRWLESTISNLGSEPSVGAIIFNYRDVTERKKLESDKQERIKELTCLYKILKDLQDNISPDKLCERMMTHLIQGMQFPRLTAVKIELNEKTYASKLYSSKLGYGLHAVIMQGDMAVGKLSVYYIEDKPFILPEEANVVESVANLLGKWLSQRQAESALRESEEGYRSLFEDSPIALWVEDFSAIKQRLDRLLQDGVQNVAAYIQEHPEFIRECASLVEISDANTSAMNLYQAKHKGELLGNLSKVFKVLSFEQFGRELTHIARGSLNFDLESSEQTLTGEKIYVQGRWSVVPGYEDSLARVIVSTIDVTERKQAEEEIRSRTEDLMMLYTLSRSLADTDDLQTVLDLVCQFAAKGVHSTFARLALIEGDELAVQAVYPIRKLDFNLSLGDHRPIITLSHCQGILKKQDPVVLQSDDGSIGEEERKALLLDQVNELCLVPLWLRSSASPNGQALGLLMVGEARSREREPFSLEKLRLTQSIANLAANAITRIRLRDQTLLQVQRLAALHVIDQAINSSMDLRLSLKVLLEQVTKQLSVDAADVLVLRPGLNHLEYAAGQGFRGTKITRSLIRLGEPYAGQAAYERQMLSIQNLAKSDPAFAWSDVIGGEDFVSYYAVPLIAKGQVKGVLEIFHRAPLDPDPEWFAYLETLAGQAAIAIDNSELYEELQRSNIELRMAYDTTIEGWSKALDLRDKETEGHTQRVTDLTQQMARAMDFNEEDIKHIRHGALLHDIGKMGIPDNILLKPGALNEEEWEIMKKHPVFAYELLAPISYLRPALDIPYCHHEKWDGTGYPRGLKGDQIPLSARIFSIIDVWDALTSDRPYRDAWPKEKALGYIKEQSGKHFDPQVVQVFLEIIA